jgi:4-methylaminobutanoate oxidase (formaldehyde-forming)
LLGRETIYRNGQRVGWLSSGGFGYTTGLPIGYGYVRCVEGVDADFIHAGEYEIEVSTQRIKATVHMTSLYDSGMKRVKC